MGGGNRWDEEADLPDELSEASRYGRLSEALEPYVHTGVLAVDEVGYLACPPDAANVLFQVVNQRYLRCRPMVFTTNKPLASWTDVLHDADLAEAIIDRVLARGRILDLRGPSYRTRHIKPPPLAPPEERARLSGKDRPGFPEPTGAGVPKEAGKDCTEQRALNGTDGEAEAPQQGLQPPAHPSDGDLGSRHGAPFDREALVNLFIRERSPFDSPSPSAPQEPSVSKQITLDTEASPSTPPRYAGLLTGDPEAPLTLLSQRYY